MRHLKREKTKIGKVSGNYLQLGPASSMIPEQRGGICRHKVEFGNARCLIFSRGTFASTFPHRQPDARKAFGDLELGSRREAKRIAQDI